MRPGVPAGGRRSRGRALFAWRWPHSSAPRVAGAADGAPGRGAAPANPSSVRFAAAAPALPGLDRVLIPVDPPTAADVGATDFTIEWWMAGTPADNPVSYVTCDGPATRGSTAGRSSTATERPI